MGNPLSSDTWQKATDAVVEGLPGVFKLVDNLLIGEKDYAPLAWSGVGWRRY